MFLALENSLKRLNTSYVVRSLKRKKERELIGLT
jgi:hypothetical protein